MAINTFKILCLQVAIKVSKKSMLHLYEKPLAKSLALYFLITLVTKSLTSKTHLNITKLALVGSMTIF